MRREEITPLDLEMAVSTFYGELKSQVFGPPIPWFYAKNKNGGSIRVDQEIGGRFIVCTRITEDTPLSVSSYYDTVENANEAARVLLSQLNTGLKPGENGFYEEKRGTPSPLGVQLRTLDLPKLILEGKNELDHKRASTTPPSPVEAPETTQGQAPGVATG